MRKRGVFHVHNSSYTVTAYTDIAMTLLQPYILDYPIHLATHPDLDVPPTVNFNHSDNPIYLETL